MKKYIAYHRVSTSEQGRSGLGLEGQEAAVSAFVRVSEGHLLRTYTEVESGKRADRPQLLKAINHARMSKAVLVIAKLDRLARNVAFLSALMESGIEFVACDNPHADRFTIHILAAVAEKEAKDISDRTKAALTAYKARGGLLGAARPECRNNLHADAMKAGQLAGAEAMKVKAEAAYADLVPMMQDMRTAGKTYRGIAAQLNDEGYTTARGNPWSHVQVRLVMERSV